MILQSIKYSQYEGKPEEWQLEGCTFDKLNLIVGKNASGKTKTLNIINALANLLSRNTKLPYMSGDFEVKFDKEGQEVKYILKYEDRKVIKEKLIVNSKIKLDRSLEGKGTINAVELGVPDMKFQIPEDEIAAFAKRDSIQHPFFDDLYYWAENLRHFYFGASLGKDSLAAFIKREKRKEELDLKSTDKVIAIFRDGEHRFGKQFLEAIKTDMAAIGYKIENIEIGPPRTIIFEGSFPSQPMGLIVKEADLISRTEQLDISQGMFRALSLIIQIDYYAQMDRIPSCILIDDIGEGLDYERSSNLIRLLIEKAKQMGIQFIMATNDRFVMNNVPLEFWSVIHRIGNKSVIHNYSNSSKMFRDFELTGLNNFDFFSSNYFLDGSDK